MTGRLENKVAIVTGGASGIGRAICQRFGREGARVVVADRNIAGAEETLSLMEATPETAATVDVNISDAFQVERMVNEAVTRFGRLDILDRKSTRLNSSHALISYAVFCLKKKKNKQQQKQTKKQTITSNKKTK